MMNSVQRLANRKIERSTFYAKRWRKGETYANDNYNCFTFVLQQFFYDFCMVWTPEKYGESSLDYRRSRKLGNSSVRVSDTGAGQ